MNILEYAASLLAPHTCLICSREGEPLCAGCSLNSFIPPVSRCYRCGSYSPQFLTCYACRDATPLRSVFVSAEHNSSAKEIVALLKFQRVKAAANVISDWLDLQLPSLSPETIILPVPTANSRVRRRGYDQACLIGRSLSRKRDLGCLEALKRTGSTRQVGSNRADRFQQLENAFVLQSVNKIRGSPVLLVDDVLTTGATLESAAKTIESHGALSIDAVVFAH